jgi:hypothetical protein
MKTSKMVTEEEIRNFAFSAFLFSTVGWILVEAQLIKGVARLPSHLMTCFVGLLISAVALRRCMLWWPVMAGSRAADEAGNNRFGPRDLVFCFALLAIAGAPGVFLRMGSISLLILCVGGIGVVPWAKISFCLRHFVVSWLILAVGTSASVVLSASGSTVPLPYLVSGWAMWIVATTLMLITFRGADGPIGKGR